ncbi:hypothetical protein HMPREF9374_2073 [Desmospora sp. 8437]|nr:hypothetical protein HMPREF9374_2073 [Desmospora sp. 8437]
MIPYVSITPYAILPGNFLVLQPASLIYSPFVHLRRLSPDRSLQPKRSMAAKSVVIYAFMDGRDWVSHCVPLFLRAKVTPCETQPSL